MHTAQKNVTYGVVIRKTLSEYYRNAKKDNNLYWMQRRTEIKTVRLFILHRNWS